MNRIKLKISNRHERPLPVLLDMPPDQHPLCYGVLVHCFEPSTMEVLTNLLTDRGFGILSLDLSSTGDGDQSFPITVDDVVDMCAYLSEHYSQPGLLIGHSLGGAAVLMAAGEIESVDAIAVIGAPARAMYTRRMVKGNVTEHRDGGSKGHWANVGGRSFLLAGEFLEDNLVKPPENRMSSLRKAILILHSPQDQQVDIGSAAELFVAAHHPKSFVSLDGADHLIGKKEDAIYCGQMIVSWSLRYLSAVENEPGQEEFETVARMQQSAFKFQVRIMAGRHALISDEPEGAGGNDTGPTPYQLVSAALGACTAMTMRMYADRKKWNLDAVNVYLNHAKKYSEDCLHCEEEVSRIDHFDRVIEIKGELDEDQRNRLMEIANKCPVHRTLEGEIRIQTSLMTEREN